MVISLAFNITDSKADPQTKACVALECLLGPKQHLSNIPLIDSSLISTKGTMNLIGISSALNITDSKSPKVKPVCKRRNRSPLISSRVLPWPQVELLPSHCVNIRDGLEL